MSASDVGHVHGPHDRGPHGPGHIPDIEEDTMHITVGGYVTGFVLAVVLTAIPFWIVMGKVITSSTVITLVILGLAMVQIYVHMVFFLHMTSKAEGGWTWMSLIFTLVLVVITLSGSLWIMYHLNTNMHLPSPAQMRNVP
jgi:cytochrome o ubiquinol oxidase operon protein cyoD